MATLPTTFTFARSGNPNIIPPAGPVALGSQLDSNFAACAPLINEVNYPTSSLAGIALAQVAINNGAAAATDQVVAGFGLAGGGAIGINPVVSAGPELAGVAGLGVTNLTGLVNRTGPGAYENVTLEAGSGITITPGTNSLTISSGGVTPAVVQSAMGTAVSSSTVEVTFANPLTPGNFLIALWATYTTSYFPSSSWTTLVTQGEAADNLIANYRQVMSGDSQTQQCGTVAASTALVAMFEVSGLVAPPTIDVMSLSQTNGTTSHTATAGPTTTTDLALVLSYSTNTPSGLAPDGSWSVDQSVVNLDGQGRDGWCGHKLYSTVGSTVSETTTFTTSSTNEVILLALKYNGSGVTIPPLGVNSQSGTSYTLQSYDARGLVVMTSASANTVTVPPNSSAAFQVGDAIAIEQAGAGKTTIAAGAGVTINDLSTLTTSIVGQYGVAQLVKTATNTWTLFGAIGG